MPEPDREALIAAVIAAVGESAKYRNVAPALIRAVAEDMARRYPRPKEAIKAAKNKLHQVAGAYLDSTPPYDRWLADLHNAAGDPKLVRETCRALLAAHTSTRERLPILTDFYGLIWAVLPPVRSVIDVACGLNPLAIPLMGLPTGVTYTAVDLYADMADFLNAFFGLIGQAGAALCADVLQTPLPPADCALILKALPPFEQIRAGGAAYILDAVPAPNLVVSYPVASLGGRGKGMAEQYTAQFMALMAGRNWQVERHLFPSELVFIVRK
jgi:16S rRNA (guanine(1405)-N(7))-methyltransferase